MSSAAFSNLGTMAGSSSPYGALISMGISLVSNMGQMNRQSDAVEAQVQQQQAAASRERWEAEREADRIREDSEQRAERLRRRQEKDRARRLNAMGSSGVQLSGSSLLIEEGSAYDDELDAQALLGQGAVTAARRRADGLLIADDYESRADELRRQGNRRQNQGLLDMGSDLFSRTGLFQNNSMMSQLGNFGMSYLSNRYGTGG